MQNTLVTVESIVEELKKIAFADLGHVVEWDETGVRIKSSAELTPAQRASISEVSETSTKIGAELVNSKKTLKFYNKLTALDMLMKHTGGYVTVNEIIDKMTDQQIEELAAKLQARIGK
jgi:phage terminase small subunit